MRGELTKKNLVFSFLFILGFSLIDAYVHPLLFARSLPFSTFISAIVETLLLFGVGVLCSIVLLRLRPWMTSQISEVRTLSIERLVPLYVLLLTIYSLLLLIFRKPTGINMFSVGTQVLAAFSFIFYLLIRKTRFRYIWDEKKLTEVFLQILIPLVAIEILSTLYMNMVSSSIVMLVVFILS